MRIIFKKSKWSPLLFTKLMTVAILTHLSGIGWGIMAVLIIDSLHVIIARRN